MTALPLMLQGTMSGVGKSLLVAGLCRVFAQDGYRTAPFKAQNMALNSAVTADGLEMGRAQFMQAEAAGIEPETALNPVLLKPTSDVGSQVIVAGRPIGTMSARDYFARKTSLVPRIMESYRDLASRFDIVVIEGAGSPAEINLKADDIVNMGMAARANAPVLLVGDIDRGGVFAQLAGTLMLLEPHERARVKATVVNKFRGDATLLDPGLVQLRALTGVPVAGVVPYVELDIDDEDSLSDRFLSGVARAVVDIAVIRLPRISNATDFIALDAVEGVGVRLVSRARDLGTPDLIVIPGTKSTLGDLRWMRENGLEAAVLKRASTGIPVLGVCGGYQMLGRTITDATGVEGEAGSSVAGLGLLPVDTRFLPIKRQVRSCGEIAAVEGALAGLSGATVEGYEIHMGETERLGGRPFAVLHSSGEGDNLHSSEKGSGGGEGGPEVLDGCQQGNVYGTYLHGLFDSTACAQALVSALLAARGLDPDALVARDMTAYKQEQYDKLADIVRRSLDMDLVYQILRAGA